MSDVTVAFEKLLGRQPSSKERENLYRVREALGIKDNDALWLIIIALEHYQTLYGRFPAAITEAAKATLAEAKAAATAQAHAAASEAKRDLAEAVARTAHDIAKQVATTRMFRWAAGCTAVVVITITGVGWFSYAQGRSSGLARGWAEGRRDTQDEQARASWANTPEGQVAYGLAQAGSLRELATCGGRGWQVKNGVCFPHGERGNVYGWRIPGAVGTGKR